MAWNKTSIFIFCALTLIYGSAYAAIAQGIKYFNPGVFQTLRMVFGVSFCLIVSFVRYYIDHLKFKENTKKLFNNNKMIINLIIGGMINMGLPHCLISTGQKWVSSASVQLITPLATTVGAAFSHFVLDDEKFSKQKLISLILSIVGVVLTSIPSFSHKQSTNSSDLYNLILGYILVLISIIMFGIAPVFFKWKTPNIDITLSVDIQLSVSLLFAFLWSMVFDGWDTFKKQIVTTPFKGMMWPLMLGVVVSGMCIHGFMYLVGSIGSFGSNLLPFGQIIVGVAIGIIFMGEWDKYTWYEIAIVIIGIVVLFSSMGVGINSTNAKQQSEHEEDISHEDAAISEL